MRKSTFGLVIVLVLAIAGTVGAASEPWTQYDMDGATVGISTRFTGVTPFGPRGAFNWHDPDPRLQAHIENVEEMFNAEIEFLPYPGEWNVMSTLAPEVLAGEANISVINADLTGETADRFPLAMEGYIWALDDILDSDYYATIPEAFRSTEGLDVQGKVYGFEGLNTFIEPCVILWNKDMFDREGLPNLHELYAAGEWTWDVFEEIAIAATRDTSGDGEIDQWGFNLFWSFDRNIANFVYSNGGTLTQTVDGEVVITFDEPAAVETYELMHRLHSHQALRSGGDIHDGTVAMAMGLPHALQYQHVQNLVDDYALVPLPRGPRAVEHVAPQWNRWMYVIPVTVENPRAVIEIMHALRKISEPYMDVSLDAWEDTYWDGWGQFAPDRESFDVWQWAAYNQVYVENRELAVHNGLGTAISQIVRDGESPATALAAIRPGVQAVLDEIYGQ